MLQADLVEPYMPRARIARPHGGPGRVSRLTGLLLGIALTAVTAVTAVSAGTSAAGAALGLVDESTAVFDVEAGVVDEVRHGDEDCEHGHESSSCPQCPSCSGGLPLGFTAGLGSMRPGDHPGHVNHFGEVTLEGIPHPPRSP